MGIGVEGANLKNTQTSVPTTSSMVVFITTRSLFRYWKTRIVIAICSEINKCDSEIDIIHEQ